MSPSSNVEYRCSGTSSARMLLAFLVLSAGSNTCQAFTISPVGGAAIGSPTSLNALVAVDLPAAISTMDDFYRTAPLQSAFLTCGMKASVADAVAQRMDGDSDTNASEGSKDNVADAANDDDARSFSPLRNLAFILYGGLYTGCAQSVIYNVFFPQIFGTGNAPLTILSEVLVDSFLVAPLLCLPIAYFTKALVFNYSLTEGLRRYAEDIQLRGLLTKYWMVWLPVQTLTFSVIPEHLRIPFVAMVSFFWFIILSFVSDGDNKPVQEG